MLCWIRTCKEKNTRLDTLNRNYNNEKQDILSGRAEKYKSISTSTKDNLLGKGRQAYQEMGSTKKNSGKKEDRKKQCMTVKCYYAQWLEFLKGIFLKKVIEGPSYICSACNRLLYRKTVTELKKGKYIIQHIFTGKESRDNKEYICNKCSFQRQILCQAVHNRLFVDEIPSELKCLEKLGQILIAQQLLFQKIVIMPKGQIRKIKLAICNVPVDCDQTCNVCQDHLKGQV